MGVGSSAPITHDVSDKPVVVIVGGGVGGTSVAKILDQSGLFNVIVLERKTYFLHNVAALRTSVVKNFSSKIIVPYTNLLTNGVVLKAEVEHIAENGVKVFGQEELIKYDYLVLATGSSYAFPGRIAEVEAEKAHQKYQKFHEIVAESQNILVVGAGPVGIELAGEIAHAYKGTKKVTILSAAAKLLPNPPELSDKLRIALRVELEKLGVEVILGDRVTKLEEENQAEEDKQSPDSEKLFTNAVSGRRTVTTDKGQSIETDLVMFATGIKINSKVYETILSTHLDERKRVKTNAHLQVEDSWNVFALGDCRSDNTGLAYHAGMEASVVAQNIIAIQKSQLKPGAKLPQTWERPPAALLVPTGPEGGAAEVGGAVLGPWFVSWIKGKELFVSKTWKDLKAKMPADLEEKANVNQPENIDDTKLKNLTAAMGWSSPEHALDTWRSGGLPARPLEDFEEHT
eukprot:TRINITY_DN8155_c0_g1_i1.p1 TRINITY_DN8155_c0_g1~~TRINITY_DN8155_c0_g1_i1.p1  ORF type:complete len:458 (+),score=140.03 TRINITY_DN8155_c0_g1_i1:112-1485(+)